MGFQAESSASSQLIKMEKDGNTTAKNHFRDLWPGQQMVFGVPSGQGEYTNA